MKHTVEKTRREYNQWVADETLEDYALRYSPSGFRKWSPLLLANTALGGISFLALEAIGAVLLLNYGFSNAFWAIMLSSLIIFIAGFPISYYAARYNIDIDLLTRSAGFGYIGSTVTSLIYASFCFIFFAIEAAIMAQALKLYFALPLVWGYLLCSLIIIPIVFYGVTAINQLHRWTQPIWLVLMVLPFYFVFQAEPKAFETFIGYQGELNGSNTFDWYHFGIATGIAIALIAQIGEQVDYLRFMPDKQKSNRIVWWASLIAAGPGWIVLGCLKQLGGGLLASLVVMTGLGLAEAKEPVQMYLAAYQYVFNNTSIALLVTTIFVIISQIKINVTNAYAGSLAWSNFFSRITHNHPGRVVWLAFNIGIALLLMELGVFEAMNKVLGLYSNIAVAWIFAVFADLVINKPLKLSPPIVEFKRAHLYDFNPVGFVSMLVASFVSILAFSGLFGEYAQAYSWLFALLISLILSPLIAMATKGKYYIARENTHFVSSDELVACGVCEQHYAETDMAHCPFHEVAICSLCCTLEANCRDQCKPSTEAIYHPLLKRVFKKLFKQGISDNIIRRIASLILVSGSLLSLLGFAFWLVYSDIMGHDYNSTLAEQFSHLYALFGFITVLVCIASWWVVLSNESRLLAETELNEQNEILDQEINERKQIEADLRSRTDELALHNDILQLIGGGAHLKHILKVLALAIESLHPEMLCSVLLLDATKRYLHSGAAPSLPDFYNQAIDGIEIGEGVGSCGTAAYSKKQVIVEDIQQHPYWQPYKALAEKAGLAACWSQPIFNSKTKQVLGTFAIYHQHPAKPTTIEMDLFKSYATLAALAIEHANADAELRIAAHAFDVQEGIIVTDANTVILKVNKAFTEITGYSAEEAMGQTPSLLQSLKQGDAFYKSMWQEVNETGGWQGETLHCRKNGEVYPEWLKLTAVKDSEQSVTHYVASFTDITLRKQAEERIQQLAYYDPLTNLPNRRHLQDRIEQSIARANRKLSQFAVLMLDLDRFKAVNDTLGHLAGDELLKQVAQRILSGVREVDVVARLGGDEFMVLLESFDHIDDVGRIADKLVHELSEPFVLEQSNDVRIGVSIGICVYPEHGNSVEKLMGYADMALYLAKDNGRGCFAYFTEELTQIALEKLQGEAKLRFAIKNQELRVFYQPQVDIESGEILGAEALVRWQDPDKGLLFPDYFIPVAEETGLIISLGEWVLREVCRQGKQWLDEGLPQMVLAVNVSPRQFEETNLVEVVTQILDETNFPAECLELEVTEGTLMQNQEEAIVVLNKLRSLGVRFAMDDFGTGYSSLAYLKRFPLDVLKIDKSFIDDIPYDESDMEITATIISMGRNLQITVLAEGVETAEQLDFLKKKGCASYQGYYKSKPVNAEAFVGLLM